MGDGHDFLQFMADENDPHVLGGHGPQGGEQPFRLLRGQGGRGLVEDQNAGAADQGLHDLQALLLADRQVADPGVGEQIQSEALFNLPHALQTKGAIQTKSAAGLPHHQVFQDRMAGHQVVVLVHHPDAMRQCVRGTADMHRPAGDGNPPAVRPVNPEQDVHQGGFSGPVFPEQPQDVAVIEGQIDTVVGPDVAETLADTAHLQQ